MTFTINKQQGSAAIILVFLLIPLFGAIFLALEGTRYIQKQNRLADATEAAALAITMANRGEITDYEKKIATAYVQSYVRQIKDEPGLSVSFSEGENIVGTTRKPYFEYKVDATTKHKSWFSSLLIPSFNPTESVINKAVARNYPEMPGDQFIDLVFVADFSGSMKSKWNSTSKTKLSILKKSISFISETILKQDANRVAIVPFDYQTAYKKNNKIYFQKKLNEKDYSETIKKMMSKKNYFNSNSSFDHPSHSIGLTNDVIKLKALNNMSINGMPGTASYEGIMKAAEILYQDKINPKKTGKAREKDNKKLKMILILSDGKDGRPDVMRNLVKPDDGTVGMCEKIKNVFTKDGGKFFMAFIGIDFIVSSQTIVKNCVGEDNIVDVKDVTTLVSEIEKMMQKASSTAGVSKLHYRHTN